MQLIDHSLRETEREERACCALLMSTEGLYAIMYKVLKTWIPSILMTWFSLEQFQHFWLQITKIAYSRAIGWMLHGKTSGLELCMICIGQVLNMRWTDNRETKIENLQVTSAIVAWKH